MASKLVKRGLILMGLCVVFSCASGFEFEVGGAEGWTVPPVNDSKTYNDWASENRFRVGDSVHFRYQKDSVMEVTEEDYKNCNSTRPAFYSNTGNTIYSFNRSGSFYFISGVSGHCQKGERMIVKVMSSSDDSGSSSEASPAAVTEFFHVFAASILIPLMFSQAGF